MQRMIVVLLVATAFVFVSLGSVYAHPRYGHRGGDGWEKGFGLVRLLNKLDLSREQEKQVASILGSHRSEIGTVATQLAEATEALMNAAAAEEFTEDAVKRAAHAVAEQQEQLFMLRARIMNEIKGILSPEQAATLQDMKEKRAERMKDHIEFRLDALDKWIAKHSK